MTQNMHKVPQNIFLLEKWAPYFIPEGTMSSSNQRFSSGVLSEAIQKFKRDKVAKKIRKRNENGWEEVHAEMKSCELSKNIRNLPPELRERILKELVAIKINEKNEMGWQDVHDEIGKLPYGEMQGQITKVFLCNKCNTCKIPGLCVACYENEKKYHTLVDREEAWDLEEKGFVGIWAAPKRISESKQEIEEREENIRMLRLQAFKDKLCEEHLEQKAEKRRGKGREVVNREMFG